MTPDYINRIRRVVRQMLQERDADGEPIWMRPEPFDRRPEANRFHDELCYRLRLASGFSVQLELGERLPEMSGGKQ